MSDSEDEYVYDSDEDDEVVYDSDVSGEEEVDDGDDALIKIENSLYDADEARESGNATVALTKYKEVIDMETAYAEAGNTPPGKSFTCYQYCTGLAYGLGQQEDMLAYYTKLLTFLGTSQVTANQAEAAIKEVLSTVERSSDVDFTRKVYSMTTDALQSSGNENLLFATQLRLCRSLVGGGELDAAGVLAESLHASLRGRDGKDDTGKSTKLVEVYAVKIALATERGETGSMEEYHDKVMGLRSAVPDVRTFGQIKEAFGKMHMAAGDWDAADAEFFDAMKNYMEAAERKRAVQCLQYKVLANMCAGSDVDPFSAQEAKQFESDPDALAMVELRQAYARHDVDRFGRILSDPKANLAGDPVIAKYLSPLLRNFRAQVLVKLVKPYAVVKLSYLARRLKVSAGEVEAILVGLIHDEALAGSMDQVAGLLYVASTGRRAEEAEAAPTAGEGEGGQEGLSASAAAGGRVAAQAAVEKWADALVRVQGALAGRLA